MVAARDAVGHSGFKWYEAYGTTVTPSDDAGQFNPYPMVQVTARDKATGKVIASTSSVLPGFDRDELRPVPQERWWRGLIYVDRGGISNPALSAEQEWRYNALRT